MSRVWWTPDIRPEDRIDDEGHHQPPHRPAPHQQNGQGSQGSFTNWLNSLRNAPPSPTTAAAQTSGVQGLAESINTMTLRGQYLSCLSPGTVLITAGYQTGKDRQVLQWQPVLLRPPPDGVQSEQISSHEASQGCVYFEVRIESSLFKPPVVGIGLAPPFYNAGMVGWYESIGYHADDGKVFDSNAYGTDPTPAHQVTVGDTFGCLWLKSAGRVLFTKNGTLLQKGSLSCNKSSYLPTITYDWRSGLKAVLVRDPGHFAFALLNSWSSGEQPAVFTGTAPLSTSPSPTASSTSRPASSPGPSRSIRNTPPTAPSQPRTNADQDFDAAIEANRKVHELLMGFQAQHAAMKAQVAKLEGELADARKALEDSKSSLDKFSDPLHRLRLSDAELGRMEMDQLRKLKEQVKEAQSAIHEAIEEKDKCIVCMEERKSMAFLPCKHICCCTVCGNVLATCPICRAAITEKLSLYNA